LNRGQLTWTWKFFLFNTPVPFSAFAITCLKTFLALSRICEYNHTDMQSSYQKVQIVSSLQTLNHVQTQKVMEYINRLTDNSHRSMDKISKGEAMRQINQALNQNHPRFTF
jgi:hypothetical protein